MSSYKQKNLVKMGLIKKIPFLNAFKMKNYITYFLQFHVRDIICYNFRYEDFKELSFLISKICNILICKNGYG